MVNEKKIVDEVPGWLRLYEDGSVDRTWTGPPEIKFITDQVPSHEKFISGVATRDMTIDSISGHRVRIYLPEQEPHQDQTKLPIILHFHGGGFCISQADWFMYYNAYTRLAKAVPAICVSVYLRLAPEHRLPAACDDGFTALLWLRSLARGESQEQWLNSHGDFTRVFLVGDSSGGTLVHQVAARAGQVDLTPLRVAGGILINPGILRSERSRSELEKPQSPFFNLEMIDKSLALALPVGSTKDHPITCPMGPEAPSLDDLNFPSFLLCVAEDDLMADTQMQYYEAMKRANKDVALLISPGMAHCFYLNVTALDLDPHTAAQTAGLIDRIKEFIKKD